MQGLNFKSLVLMFYFNCLYFTELPVASPLTHEVLRTLNHWQEILNDNILVHGPPSIDYIPGEFFI